MLELEFKAEVWLADAADAWHFVSLPADSYAFLKERGGTGFGSVRVEATVGSSTWKTSVFPDSKRRRFVLPLKAMVRRAEGIEAGSSIQVRLRIVD